MHAWMLHKGSILSPCKQRTSWSLFLHGYRRGLPCFSTGHLHKPRSFPPASTEFCRPYKETCPFATTMPTVEKATHLEPPTNIAWPPNSRTYGLSQKPAHQPSSKASHAQQASQPIPSYSLYVAPLPHAKPTDSSSFPCSHMRPIKGLAYKKPTKTTKRGLFFFGQRKQKEKGGAISFWLF